MLAAVSMVNFLLFPLNSIENINPLKRKKPENPTEITGVGLK
jgi:hypothetical protein